MAQVLQKPYNVLCTACGCSYSFTHDDVKEQYMWIFPNRRYVECPVCGNRHYLRDATY